jgi:predicted ATP-grasp superfamily ATP-dependent carboligase
MQPEKKCALVLGDDLRIFLTVVRSLGRAGIRVHAAPFDWHAPALKSKYVSEVHRLPGYSDDPEGWLSKLQTLVAEHQFELIIPCCDRAILPLDLHRSQINGTKLAIPQSTAMDRLFDKELTRDMATGAGIPVVPGRRLSSPDTAQELISEFGLPLVLKPSRSYAIDKLDTWGRVWIIENVSQLSQALAAIDEPGRYLVEGYFAGEGVGVSVISEGGNIALAFQHRRLREGWGGSSSFRISESVDEPLLDACRKICQRTALTGVCMFEFRVNRKRAKWVLLETNARFWGSLALPVSLGVDFPKYLYELLVNGVRPPSQTYRVGVRSRNVALDARNILSDLSRSGWTRLPETAGAIASFFAQPMNWLLGREISDTVVIDDLRPAFAELLDLTKAAVSTRRGLGMPRDRSKGDGGVPATASNVGAK